MRRKGSQNRQLPNRVSGLFLLLWLDRRVISVVSILSMPEMLEHVFTPYERQY